MCAGKQAEDINGVEKVRARGSKRRGKREGRNILVHPIRLFGL